jgi:3-deoxy-D-manno-octulosonate 8-phosphate phosphatase (KDO 8-P phosphatase)
VEQSLSNYSSDLIKKAAGIKAIFLDVDGVLTDSKLVSDESGQEIKRFNVRDGLIMPYLKKSGIIIGIISGRESAAVSKRSSELKMDFCYQSVADKAGVCENLIDQYKLQKSEAVFIGCNINDLPVFKMIGLSVCPADAPTYIRDNVELVTKAKGGEGVLREIADLLLPARGDMQKIVNA